MRNLIGRRLLSYLLCLCIILSMAFTQTVYADSPSEQLIGIPLKNAGFETAGDGSTIPGWTQTFGVDKNGSITVDTSVTHTGSNSLKIYDNDTVNFGVESDKAKIEAGKDYRLSAFVNISSGSVQLQVKFYDSKDVLIKTKVHSDTYAAGPIGQWQQLSVNDTAPENAVYASAVLVTGKNGKGTSYWDDVELFEVVADGEQDLGTYDVLQNPGFELPASGSRIPEWKRVYPAGNSCLDGQIKYEGDYSLKLDNTYGGEAGVLSNYINVTPGNTYTVSSMVYSDVYNGAYGAAEIHIKFFDESNSILSQASQVLKLSVPEWRQVSVSAVAPDNAVKAAVMLYSGTEYMAPLYFDKVGLKEELPPPPSKRHLANGGFEAGEGSVIPGWKLITKDADVSISTENAFSGSKSLYVKNIKTTGKGVNLESDLMDVEEGETYLLTSNVFIEERSIEGFYVYVYDEAGKLVKSDDGKDFHAYLNATSSTTPPGEWAFIQKAFTVQPGGKKLKVSLIYGNKYSYSFYIDNLTILKEVKNGDFEKEVSDEGIPGWKRVNPAADSGNFGITGEKFTSGSKSLFIQSETGKFHNVISDLIDVEPGETYTALADTYIEYGSSDMYVRFFDDTGKYISKQNWSIRSDIIGSWFTNSVKFTVPEDARKVAIMYAGSNKKDYLYYIDAVKIFKGDHVVKEEPVPENSITNVGQDMGVQIRKVTLMRGDTGKDGEGRDVIYTVAAGAPAVFNVIDIETEKVVKSMPMPDTSGAWSVKVSTDGTVYLGAYNLGLLYRYFPETGELKNLGHPLPTKDSVLYPMDSGKDGKMYGSTYPTAHLYEYDPATDKFTDFGTMSYSNSGERWTRVVVLDSENNKIYAGVGNTARLLEYDLATGAKRDLLPPQYSNITAVYDLNLVGGKLFAKKEANNANEMFVLKADTGELVEVTMADTGTKTFDVPMYSRGVSPKSPVDNKVYFAGYGGLLYSYDLDTDTVKSTGASIDGAAIAYSFVELEEEGFPGYSLVGLSGNGGKMYKYNLQTGKVKTTDLVIPAEPVNIHDIEKGPDGRIYTTGYLQGNLGVHVPTTGESYYLNGMGQGEGVTVIHNKMYIGAYPDAKIYEYDLDKPWNRDNSDKLNPVALFSLKDNFDIPGYTNQDRPFGMAGSEDLNKLFVGTVPKNGMLGGAFAVYDLTTRENPEVYWNIVPDQSIISLAYKEGKVYGGTSIHGGQGGTPTAKEAVLFVWDVEKGEKVSEVVPVAGKTAITALHIGPDGNIWGLANGALFIYDTEEGKVVYSKDEFPDASGRWIDGSMDTGTDGNVYAAVAGRFFKVDAETRQVTVLASQVRKLAQDDFGNFYMFTNPEGPNLYKYSAPSLVLKLSGAELSAGKTSLNTNESTGINLKGILEKGRETKELSGARIEYNTSGSGAVEIKDGRVTARTPGNVQITATVTLAGETVQTNAININVVNPAAGEPDNTDNTDSGEKVVVPETKPADTVKENGLVLVDDKNVLLKDGNALVEIKQDILAKAIGNAAKSAQKELVIQIPETGSAGRITALIPAASVGEAEAKGIDRICIVSPIARISVDTNALKDSTVKNAQKVEISIARADKKDLSPEVVQQVGDRTVYEFNIYADGHKVTGFAGIKALRITLPYNIAPGEDADKVVAYYRDDKGNLTAVKNCTYDAEYKAVTFSTGYLGQYAAKEAEVSFIDVKEESWSKGYINALAAREIISGKSSGGFEPEADITRAEFLKLLMYTFDLIDEQAEAGFSDVKEGEWYYSTVASARKHGIVSGIGDNRFGAENPITRQEMAAMAYRAVKAAKVELEANNTPEAFNDIQNADEYALEGILAMQKAGILNGVGNNLFAPSGRATREEAAKIVYLLLQQM